MIANTSASAIAAYISPLTNIPTSIAGKNTIASRKCAIPHAAWIPMYNSLPKIQIIHAIKNIVIAENAEIIQKYLRVSLFFNMQKKYKNKSPNCYKNFTYYMYKNFFMKRVYIGGIQTMLKKRNIICSTLIALILIFVLSSTAYASQTKTGFVTIDNKTYYLNSNGEKVKGWLTLQGKKYYFNKKTGVQAKGWVIDSKGRKRYFTKNKGVMATGWVKDTKGRRRYFNPSSGIMKTGWLTLNNKKYYLYSNSGIAATKWVTDKKGNKRYFSSSAGVMRTGWISDTKGNKRYFDTKTGIMYTKLKKISGYYYYFYSSSGKMAKSCWLTSTSGLKRYFDNDGKMATGTKTIDGKTYTFKANGALIGEVASQSPTQQTTSSKTIKNYLLGALQPVGKALYVWGGGWNDSTRKGISPTWQSWYNSQSSDYDYNDYRDLSTANRAKGLDCSGFVGWAAYQVMQTKSNVGYGYTVVAAEVGSYYKSLGWGTIKTQSDLSKDSWTLKAGDVGYNSGHTWIVLGQCSDKSAVIVHSTPNAGCQISGTPTPSGDYNSEAIALAKKYMSKYSGYTKYSYHTSSGNYVRNGNYLRWNTSTLSDPDGYRNKTADKILADLFK